MQKLVLYCVLVLFLLVPTANARPGGTGAVWKGAKTVTVWDYSSDEWEPVVARAVQEMNKALPRNAPRLRLKDQSPKSCDAVKARKPPKNAIIICSRESGHYAGSMHGHVNNHTFDKGVVYLTLIGVPGHDEHPLDFHQNTACHELMHGVSNVNDDYTADRDSCVHGDNPSPGSWDRKYLKRTYRQHGR